MNFHSRFIKGILVSLMVVMILGVGMRFLSPATYAASCDPLAEDYDLTPGACADPSVHDPATVSPTATPTPEAGSFEAAMSKVQPADEVPQTTESTQDMVKKAANYATFVHRLFLPLINYFSYQIGNFLGTDYVYNGPMGKNLQKIWVVSRNLVNIAFVFLLLWMALKEIFLLNKESELKKNLITFVLLLVAVNFSWLATRIVLDAANVATNVVFAIPSGLSDPPAYGQCQINDDPTKPFKGACYPTAILAPADSGVVAPLYFEDKEGDSDNCAKVKAAYGGSAETATAETAYLADGTLNTSQSVPPANKKLQRRTSICVENLNLFKYNQNTAVIYLTYGMARIQNLVNSTGGNGNIGQLTVGFLMSLIIQIAYTVSLFALFAALIVRMAMLWFFVGFSPFMVLVIWFQGAGDYDLGEFKFGFKEFANWAFVPVKVGAIFAVSFIMISVGQSMGNVDTTLFDKGDFVNRILSPESLFMGMGSLQTLIWLIMCLAVLWMGVFAVLSKLSIVSGISNWIKTKGTEAAKMVATSPYWAPVLPLGKGGEQQSIKQTLAPIKNTFSEMTKGYYESGISNEPADVRTANGKAKSDEAKREVSRAISHDLTFKDRGEAQRFARAFGLELERFLKLAPETQMSVLKTAGADDSQATKLADALRAANAQTPAQLQVQAQAKAEADRVAADKLAKPAGPAAPATPAPTDKSSKQKS